MAGKYRKVALQQKLQVQPLKMHQKGVNKMEQHDWDNYANQLNPEHDAYWQSRGEDGCPEDDE